MNIQKFSNTLGKVFSCTLVHHFNMPTGLQWLKHHKQIHHTIASIFIINLFNCFRSSLVNSTTYFFCIFSLLTDVLFCFIGKETLDPAYYPLQTTSGMSEHEVLILAGHASFNTTHRFYLAVATDLVDRARVASGQVLCQDFLHTCCAPPILAHNEKRPAIVNNCQPKSYRNGQGRI